MHCKKYQLRILLNLEIDYVSLVDFKVSMQVNFISLVFPGKNLENLNARHSTGNFPSFPVNFQEFWKGGRGNVGG